MLRFYATIDIIADDYQTENEKKVFMRNVEKILQESLDKMTLTDWKVTVHDIEKIEEEI